MTTIRRELDTGAILVRHLVPPERVVDLVRAGDALADPGADLDAVHRGLCEAVCAMGAVAAVLWVEDEPDVPRAVAAHHGDPAAAQALMRGPGALAVRCARTGPGRRLLSRALHARAGLLLSARHRVVTSIEGGALAASLVEAGLGELMLVPVRGRQATNGLLVAARSSGLPFTSLDLDHASILARRAGLAVDNARLMAQVRDQVAVLDGVSDAVVATDAALRVTTFNPAAARLYGVEAERALGRPVAELFDDIGREEGLPTDDVWTGDEQRPHAVAIDRGHFAGRIRQVTVDGAIVDVEASITVRRDARGGFAGLVWVNRDLSPEIAARVAARAQERFTRELMDAFDSRAGVIDGHGTVTAGNARWHSGLTDRERCVCGPVAEGRNWVEALRTCGLDDVQRFADEVVAVLAGRRHVARHECRCADAGPTRATAVEVARLEGVGDGAVVVQTDVSWRRRLEDELTHRATHDDLTGLPNRAALLEALRASVRRLGEGRRLAVLFCDLDGFKDINDGLGHGVGDEVLVAVSRRLRQRCRSADVVARFGGDEFVVVTPVESVQAARALADRLVQTLAEPIVVGDAEVAPGASIGLTVVDEPPPGDDPAGSLLRDADTAMYHAKERGRGRYEVFGARLRVEASERLEYASALRRAIAQNELDLVFQTRRLCLDRRVAGVEALMRWHHPVFGTVSPTTFVPIAERTGRIAEIGGWALGRALGEVADLADRRLTVGVNVSPRQLQQPRLVETVDHALTVSGLEPWRLCLEITEGALVEDPDAARELLGRLRRLGVTVALDDFGTGWSSLSYLRTLPVDVIKIDRSFVADLPRDPDACALVAAVLGLGHGMGLAVVAEGVESEDQLTLLRDLGCDEYQGFIDGLPGRLDDVLAARP